MYGQPLTRITREDLENEHRRLVLRYREAASEVERQEMFERIRIIQLVLGRKWKD